MFRFIGSIAITAFLFTTLVTNAADEVRRPKAEPAYNTSAPRYCLIELGENKRQLWVVVDGKRVFIDKNLDGTIHESEFIEVPVDEDKYDPASFPKTDVVWGSGDSSETYVLDLAFFDWFDYKKTLDFDQVNPFVSVVMPDKRRYGAWGDHQTALSFARSPERASVIRVGVLPLTMGFEVRQPLQETKDPKSLELNAAVGIAGTSPGTFTWLGYGSIPNDKWPDVEFIFPSRNDSAQLITVRGKLDHRC